MKLSAAVQIYFTYKYMKMYKTLNSLCPYTSTAYSCVGRKISLKVTIKCSSLEIRWTM